MTLEELCQLSDVFFMAYHKSEIIQDYITISDIIFTDGTFSHHIRPDGYIQITDLRNANFIVFADQNQKLFLAIYNHILPSKFKIVFDAIQSLRNQLQLEPEEDKPANESEVETTTVEENTTTEEKIIKDIETNEKDDTTLIDITNFSCKDCGSFNMTPFKYDLMGDITTQCKDCKTIFTLTPSIFYVLKSRTSLADTSQYAIPKSVKNQLLNNSGCDRYEY